VRLLDKHPQLGCTRFGTGQASGSYAHHGQRRVLMNALFAFLASLAGRVVRLVAGLALILIGFLAVQGIWGWVLVVVGLVPLLAGLFDYCLFAPLAGLPFAGKALRQALDEK
jgi:hypothetical protein